MNRHINTLRHQEVFDAEDFGDRTVDLIGAGAVGSKVAVQLANLGISNLRVFDGDEVESHNIPNQAFGRQDIGRPKAEALADRIQSQTGLEVDAHAQYVNIEDPDVDFGEVVFLMVDSMEARRKIYENALQFNMTTGLVVEVRMGPDNWRVYSFNPNFPEHNDSWENTLYTDEEAVDQPSEDEEGGTACNISQTVGPTSSMLAGHAAWQLIGWQQNQYAVSEFHQQIAGVRPLVSHFSDFD